MGLVTTFPSPLTTLLDVTPGAGSILSPELERIYGGPLGNLPTTTQGVAVNMISTLDGIVALSQGKPTGGGELRREGWHDTALAGMLRASSDALIIGGSTFRAFPHGSWTAASFCPELTTELVDIAPPPLVVVITKSGHIPPVENPELSTRIITLTTPKGAKQLSSVPTWNEEKLIVKPAPFSIHALLSHLRDTRGIQRVLSEGGPTLIGSLFRERLVRDLFLTVSPMLIGRNPDSSPLSLVEGISYLPQQAPYGKYVSIRTDGNLLYLRIRYEEN